MVFDAVFWTIIVINAAPNLTTNRFFFKDFKFNVKTFPTIEKVLKGDSELFRTTYITLKCMKCSFHSGPIKKECKIFFEKMISLTEAIFSLNDTIYFAF